MERFYKAVRAHQVVYNTDNVGASKQVLEYMNATQCLQLANRKCVKKNINTQKRKEKSVFQLNASEVLDAYRVTRNTTK